MPTVERFEIVISAKLKDWEKYKDAITKYEGTKAKAEMEARIGGIIKKPPFPATITVNEYHHTTGRWKQVAKFSAGSKLRSVKR